MSPRRVECTKLWSPRILEVSSTAREIAADLALAVLEPIDTARIGDSAWASRREAGQDVLGLAEGRVHG